MENNKNVSKNISRYGILSVIIILVFITVFSSFTTVRNGTVGIVSRMGSVQEQTLSPGFNLKIPFITNIIEMNVQTQKVELQASAASKDLQMITSTVVVNYHVDPNSAVKLYRNVGMAYEQTIISPAIQESLKAVMSQYSAEQLITKRQEVSVAIKSELANKVVTYGIVVDEFNITNLDFSSEFNAAIESKQTAQQNALRAEQELARVTIEAKQEIEKAKAEAEAIRAKAEAEAYAIRIIQEQLSQNPEYLEYQKIQKWDGKLPIVQGNSDAIIDLRDNS